MKRSARVVVAAGSLCLVVLGVACTREEAAPAGSEGTQTTEGAGATVASGIAIEMRSTPDPPTEGDNTIDVTVRHADGSPLTDGAVTVVFSMPSMPAMNMPAMRSVAELTHAGEGRYRGTGQLSMGGTWNVAVTVTRGGEQIGVKRLSIVAQ